MSEAPPAKSRPLSPHLQVWRWHVTMATSILHRATGFGLYIAAVGLTVWLAALAAGPAAFAPVDALARSPIGQGVFYLALVGVFYHLANGIRHFIWDSGAGYTPKVADASAWMAIVFALIAPVAVWTLASL